MKNEKKDNLLNYFKEYLTSIEEQSKILGGKLIYRNKVQYHPYDLSWGYIADTYQLSGTGKSAKEGDFIGRDDL